MPQRRRARRSCEGVGGALAVMEQSLGRCGTPIPECPASPGHGTLVSAGISGWEYEEGAGETFAWWGQRPSAMLGARGEPCLSCHLL